MRTYGWYTVHNSCSVCTRDRGTSPWITHSVSLYKTLYSRPYVIHFPMTALHRWLIGIVRNQEVWEELRRKGSGFTPFSTLYFTSLLTDTGSDQFDGKMWGGWGVESVGIEMMYLGLKEKIHGVGDCPFILLSLNIFNHFRLQSSVSR